MVIRGEEGVVFFFTALVDDWTRSSLISLHVLDNSLWVEEKQANGWLCRRFLRSLDQLLAAPLETAGKSVFVLKRRRFADISSLL